jgi:hypothetical protein
MKAYRLADDLVQPLRRVAMPRSPRVVEPGGTVHVIARCNHRAGKDVRRLSRDMLLISRETPRNS